jgi:3-oxoacyl-[acyl-carrier-protein] synthase III
MNEADFKAAVLQEAETFNRARAVERLLAGSFSMADYHRILSTIFHQVSESSSTFALAAANLPFEKYEAKSYLMKHAEEEKSHWEWIISDLKTTGYGGPDPQASYPSREAAAYVAFNYATAQRTPIARLGIACMLETLGATYGKQYAMKMAATLGLRKDQMMFYLGHGDTDVGHTEEIYEVLASSRLSPREWSQLIHSVEVAGHLYRQMYEF